MSGEYDLSGLPDSGQDLSGLPDQGYDTSGLPDQTEMLTGRFLTEQEPPDYTAEYVKRAVQTEAETPAYPVSPEELTRLQFRQGKSKSFWGTLSDYLQQAHDGDERGYEAAATDFFKDRVLNGKSIDPIRAMNVHAMAHASGAPANVVWDNYEEFNNQFGLGDIADPEAHKFVLNASMLAASIVAPQMLAASPMVANWLFQAGFRAQNVPAIAGLVKGITRLSPTGMMEGATLSEPAWGPYAVQTGKYIAGFTAGQYGLGYMRSLVTDRPFRPASLTDLADPDASEMTKLALSLVEMAAGGKVLHSTFNGLARGWDLLTKETLTTLGVDHFYMDPAFIKSFREGTMTKEASDIWRWLDLSADELAASEFGGFRLEVPTDKIVTVSDRPWFKRMKEYLSISPYSETSRTPSGEGRTVTPVAGLLEEPGAAAKMPEDVIAEARKKVSEKKAEPLGEIPKAVVEKAKEIGLDPDTALAVTMVESPGFNPNAKNPKSSAYGIFQFLDSTWADMGGTPENRGDVQTQIDLGVKYLYQNSQALTNTLGRKPQPWELYLAHQQGAGGASQLLQNPEAKAVDLVGEKPILLNGGTADMTAADFTSMWQKKFDQKLARVSGKEDPEVFTRDKFVAALDKNPKIPAEQKGAFIEISDAAAASWAETYGRKPEDWYSETFAGLRTGKVRDFEKGMLGQEDIKTPEFQAWFGDSKVVDESGKPLMVFHGTNTDFSEFAKNKARKRDSGFLGDGFYLSASSDLSSAYAEHSVKIGRADKAMVMPLFVSLKNPYRVNLSELSYDEQQNLSKPYGGSEGFTKHLKEQGYDGVIGFRDPEIAGKGAKYWEIVAFDPEQIKSVYNKGTFNPKSPNILEQSKKGAAQFLADTRAIIHLFETADVSTLVHELGHVLRRQLSPEDSSIIETHIGVENGVWKEKDEEDFARMFEAYIMEGKAPSSKLREVFAKLRKWLLDIYRSIKNLKVELSDEVRAVFDRLLSTEEERKANVLFQMIEDYPEPATSPIPAGAIKEYEQLQAEAARRVIALTEKIRKEGLKRETEFADQAIKKLNEEPVWRAKNNIISGGGLNASLVQGAFGKDTVKDLSKKYPGVISKTGVLALDMVSGELGFGSSDELVNSLLDFPSKAEYLALEIEKARQAAEPEREMEVTDLELALLDEEISILRQLTTGKLLKNIQQAERERTGQIRVSDVLSDSEFHNLKAAEREANRKAKEAFASGKKEEALKEKVRQQGIAQRRRDRRVVQKEYQKIKKELAKYLNDKKVEWDFREQMIQILAPFNMKAKKIPRPKESLSDFVQRKEDEGEAILFDAAEILSLSSKKLHEMGMGELRTLRDVVKHLHHLGSTANAFLGEHAAKSITEAATEIAQTIYDNARKITEQEHPLAERQKSVLDKITSKYRGLAYEQIKIEFLFRLLDNYENFGPLTRHVWQRIKKGEDTELKYAETIFTPLKEMIDKLTAIRTGWRTQKISVRNTGFSVTKEQAAAIYANAQHRDNLRHLRQGFALDRPPLSDDEIRAIIGVLSPEDRAFVDEIIEKIIPLPKAGVWETHEKLTGVPPVAVQGKYMPLKFDPRFSGIIEAAEAEKAVKGTGAFKEFFPPSIEKGMTITRKSGGAKTIRTDFLNVVVEHLSDAIKYASYGVALRDTLKIINHPLVKKAIEETLGVEAYQQIRPWLKETINPGIRPITKTETVVNHIRNNFTYFIMGWRVSTILIQPTAIFNSVPELGFVPVMKAFGEYVSSPKKARQTHEFIVEKSPFMGARTQSFDRDLYAAMGQFDPAGLQKINFVKQTGFYLISLSDRLVTEPVWMAAYSKALNGEVKGVAHGDDQRAVDYADGVVRRTQSSGMPKDLAGIQRGGVWQKMIVSQFFTFFSAVHNLLWEAWQKTARGGSWWEFIGSYWWVAVVPALFGAAMQERRAPKDGADLFKMTGKALTLYQAGRIPLLRDLANATIGGYDYRAGALGTVFDEAAKAYKIATKGQRDKGKRLALSALRLTGAVAGLPPDQAIIAMQGALDLASGKTKNPARLFFRQTKPD